MKLTAVLAWAAVSCGMIIGGLAWWFGARGLIGGGAVSLVIALSQDPLEWTMRKKRQQGRG